VFPGNTWLAALSWMRCGGQESVCVEEEAGPYWEGVVLALCDVGGEK
jgi:hypothetical protein